MSDSPDLIRDILLQLALIIAAARAGAWIVGKFGQPGVVGEILAGLALGPSLLGQLEPIDRLFSTSAEAAVSLRVLSELGLVLFMFLIGMEFNFRHLRDAGHAAAGVAVAGIALPFVLGAVLAVALHPYLAPEVHRLGFVLFFATALSITAIPVLGRIMVELDIHQTRLGALTIAAAAIDDVIGWMLLATVSALVSGGFDYWRTILMLLSVIAFVAFVFLLLGPVLIRLSRKQQAGSGCSEGTVLTIALVIVLLAAACTEALGVFSVFGPFVVGAAVSSEKWLSSYLLTAFRPLVYSLLLPVFFTYSGLRTDIGTLDTAFLWLACGLILLVATVGKVVGCGLAARLGGLTWQESGCVAAMMNTRALMGLVAINVGRDLGVVPPGVFSMLVIMAIVTTLCTTPILTRLLNWPAVAPAVQNLNSSARL